MKKLCWIALVLFIFSCKEEPIYETDFDESGWLPVSTGQIVKHKCYTLAYSEENEQAFWVYYILTSENFNKTQDRTDNWRVDTLITTGSATTSDYTGSGYVKGHLCSAASMTQNYTAMSETFYMSNMSPQKTEFNDGIWKKLENQEKNWVENYKKVWVITGPIFINNIDTIGKTNRITVPGSFYKVIFNGENQMIGFIIPNEKSSAALTAFAFPVDTIERRTKINFFPGLPDCIEFRLEAKYDLAYWN
jgi:endonuclease G, mitochondrial